MDGLANGPAAVSGKSVRFARVRAGRYYFYVNAPGHFDARRLLGYEIAWLKKLTVSVVQTLRNVLRERRLEPDRCFEQLGLRVDRPQKQAIRLLWNLAGRPPSDPTLPQLFENAVRLFPHYYRLLEQAWASVRNDTRK
ncbi:MAG TPA: hypothetical protein EYP56_03235 [Planctomycetaceae bacterium]|nr:hypothetical protein [Planctomycetaceae bacterium]